MHINLHELATTRPVLFVMSRCNFALSLTFIFKRIISIAAVLFEIDLFCLSVGSTLYIFIRMIAVLVTLMCML